VKLYDHEMAPGPRRARMFLHEKNIDAELIRVDLASCEQLGERFRELNPDCTVPVLELEDGRRLCENLAIASYLEAVRPSPPLFGSDDYERAQILEWHARIEAEGIGAVSDVFRNENPDFEGRALTGNRRVEQIAALADRSRLRAASLLDRLDAALAGREFLVGARFSFADIGAFVTVEFARWVNIQAKPRHDHLRAWHARVSARSSASA